MLDFPCEADGGERARSKTSSDALHRRDTDVPDDVFRTEQQDSNDDGADDDPGNLEPLHR